MKKCQNTSVKSSSAKTAKPKKIRLAAIGLWGKGLSDWLPMIETGLAEIAALCDADPAYFEAVRKVIKDKKLKINFNKIPLYTDYRKLLADQDKLKIDAMTISAPDHIHAAAAIPAMKMGIHVFVQKPLVRTLWEVKEFYNTAKKYGVITQMGNQGSADSGFRRNVEVLQSGIIGKVKKVHVWTNRPVWPQGADAVNSLKKGHTSDDLENLDWEAWVGPAKMRTFHGRYLPGKKTGFDPWNLSKGAYHPFSWRAFFDFGCGAFGDMACHTMNLPFRGLELGTVTKAECTEIDGETKLAFPMKSVVKLTYAARESKVPGREGEKLPEVELTWYDGSIKPSARLMPQITAMEMFKGKVPEAGCLIIGTKGIMCSCADYGQQAFIALKGEKVAVDVKDHPECRKIPVTIPRYEQSEGMDNSAGAASLCADGHNVEFLNAINGIGPVYRESNSRCYSDVDVSVPMMEGILVGVIAQRVHGPLKWDSASWKFDNPAANKLIKPHMRKGFEY